jgi:glycosyltransferase involved in cell wall biosynthesis
MVGRAGAFKHAIISLNLSNRYNIFMDLRVTILIPTRRRPEMLANCLQSILGQTRRDVIQKVVVSENSSDERSSAVAGRFSPDLPIYFVRQTHEPSAYEHFAALAQYVDSPHVALIGDDDMWDRYHLEEAQRAFHHHPSIISYYGQMVAVANETCYPLRSIGLSLLQVPTTDDRSLQDFHIWDKRLTAMHCMSHTPVNIWALVSRAEPFKEAVAASFSDPQFNMLSTADKIFIWELSKRGDTAVGRHISLFYRRHNESVMESVTSNLFSEVEETDYRITLHIAQDAMALGIDAPRDWRELYAIALSRYDLADCIYPWTSTLYKFLIPGGRPEADAAPPRGEKVFARKNYLQAFIYLITPPLFAWCMRKLRTFGMRQ